MNENAPKDSKKIIWMTLISSFAVVVITGGIIFYNKVEKTKAADKYYSEAEAFYSNGEYQKAADTYDKIDPKLEYKDTAEKTQLAKKLAAPAITANGLSMSMGDFDEKIQYVEHFYENSNQPMDSASLRTKIINDSINELLIAEYASNNNISVTSEELTNKMDEFVAQNGGQDKVEEILMNMYGINVQYFRTVLEKQLLREKVIAKIGSETALNKYLSDATSAGQIKINVER